MNAALNLPVPLDHTVRYKNLTLNDILPEETILISGDATERRGLLPIWADVQKSDPERIISISYNGNEEISVNQNAKIVATIDLRNEKKLDKLIFAERLFIDISGLSHNVWAPILKSAHKQKIPTRVLYAEPKSYKLHPSPASSTLFDLSVELRGLSPLPGFARLSGPPDEEKCLFIAMLGFEGNRPERLVLQLDPIPKVIPVIGVPGFQLEYPAFTVACNRGLLEDYRAQSELRFARASCPFEANLTLNQIRRDYPDHYMYIAPVGTKPHSLGAIWFAINNPDDTEIMFDYPVRKKGRTKGVGVIHIYDLGKFFDE